MKKNNIYNNYYKVVFASQRSSNASVSSKTSSKSVTKSCSSGPVVTRKAGQSTRRMAGNPCKADLKNCASECGKLDLKKKVKKKVDCTSYVCIFI